MRNSTASPCRSTRTPRRRTPSCASPRPSWSAGWRGCSTASRPRCSPSRWPPARSWSRCARARCRPGIGRPGTARLRARAVPVSRFSTGARGPHIETRDAWVEFPIFDAKSRSLKKAVLGKAGGTIGRNNSNVVVIEALRDITMSLDLGDRVGLVGHNGAGQIDSAAPTFGHLRAHPGLGDGDRQGRSGLRSRGRHGPRDLRLREHHHPRPVSGADPKADAGQGRRDRRVHRARATTCRCRCARTPPGCGSDWRWVWSPASTPRSCCSTKASAPWTPTF